MSARTNVAGVDVSQTNEARGVACGAWHAKGARRTLRPATSSPTTCGADGAPWWVCEACGRRFTTGEVRMAQVGSGIARACASPARDEPEKETMERNAAGPIRLQEHDPRTDRFEERMRPHVDVGDGTRTARHPDGCRYRSFAFSGETAQALRAAGYWLSGRGRRAVGWFVLGDGACALQRRASTRRELAARGMVSWPAHLAGVESIAADAVGTGDVIAGAARLDAVMPGA